MTFKRPKARILERTITAGNGPYALAGAVDGSYNAFSAFMSVGDTTFITVVEPNVAFWTGIGTYSAANQMTLTTVEETSGTFGAGTKEVFSGTLAARSAVPDDIAGAIVTGGTSTAYTVTSYRIYDSLSRMNGALVAFTPHATNGTAGVGVGITLNVDGLGAKPLRLSTGVEVQSNTLIAGTPYAATYNNSDAVWYLHGLGGNAYGIPLAGGMDYWGSAAPSSAFAFPVGQAISQTTYARLYALFGPNRYGTDSGGNFFLPNKSGRVSAAIDLTGTVLTGSTITGGAGATGLGGTGGTETKTLLTANLPAYTPSGSVASTWNPGANATTSGSGGGGILSSSGAAPGGGSNFFAAGSVASTFTGSAQGGTSAPLGIIQPTIMCNYIIRVF